MKIVLTRGESVDIFAYAYMSATAINKMFRAFADPTRLRILNLLLQDEFCVGDLVKMLDVPQPMASRHLRYLRDAGLVVCRKKGRWCFYSLAKTETTFHRNLIACLGGCLSQVPDLKADASRAKKLRKTGGCCPLHRKKTVA